MHCAICLRCLVYFLIAQQNLFKRLLHYSAQHHKLQSSRVVKTQKASKWHQSLNLLLHPLSIEVHPKKEQRSHRPNPRPILPWQYHTTTTTTTTTTLVMDFGLWTSLATCRVPATEVIQVETIGQSKATTPCNKCTIPSRSI